jgi:hypothetical protein
VESRNDGHKIHRAVEQRALLDNHRRQLLQ